MHKIEVIAISLSHYIKKRRFNRAKILLDFINSPELALNFTSPNPPFKTWLYNVIKNSNLNLIAGIVAMFQLYIFIWNYMGICSTETLDWFLTWKKPCFTAKHRRKVLARKNRLPLIPEAVKVPHLTGCVTFIASGVFFDL